MIEREGSSGGVLIEGVAVVVEGVGVEGVGVGDGRGVGVGVFVCVDVFDVFSTAEPNDLINSQRLLDSSLQVGAYIYVCMYVCTYMYVCMQCMYMHVHLCMSVQGYVCIYFCTGG